MLEQMNAPQLSGYNIAEGQHGLLVAESYRTAQHQHPVADPFNTEKASANLVDVYNLHDTANIDVAQYTVPGSETHSSPLTLVANTQPAAANTPPTNTPNAKDIPNVKPDATKITLLNPPEFTQLAKDTDSSAEVVNGVELKVGHNQKTDPSKQGSLIDAKRMMFGVAKTKGDNASSQAMLDYMRDEYFETDFSSPNQAVEAMKTAFVMSGVKPSEKGQDHFTSVSKVEVINGETYLITGSTENGRVYRAGEDRTKSEDIVKNTILEVDDQFSEGGFYFDATKVKPGGRLIIASGNMTPTYIDKKQAFNKDNSAAESAKLFVQSSGDKLEDATAIVIDIEDAPYIDTSNGDSKQQSDNTKPEPPTKKHDSAKPHKADTTSAPNAKATDIEKQSHSKRLGGLVVGMTKSVKGRIALAHAESVGQKEDRNRIRKAAMWAGGFALGAGILMKTGNSIFDTDASNGLPADHSGNNSGADVKPPSSAGAEDAQTGGGAPKKRGMRKLNLDVEDF